MQNSLKKEKLQELGSEFHTLQTMVDTMSHFHYLFAKIACLYCTQDQTQFEGFITDHDISKIELMNEYFHQCEAILTEE